MDVDLLDGWTAPVEQVLLLDGAPIDLTGRTVLLRLLDARGSVVQTSAGVSVLDSTGGHVRYLPPAGNLRAAGSPYLARWLIQDAGSSDLQVVVPSGAPDTWRVRPV